MAPVPEHAHTTGVYSPSKPRLERPIRLLQRLAGRQPLALLRRGGAVPGSRVLDAGAGTGKLVEALGAAGFDARGIDPSARSVALAESAGRPVSRESIEEHEDSGLGGVALWHVLEHVDDPVEALSRAAGWLRPDGTAIVAVPNIASLQARVAGGSWFHLDLPRHRTHFTPAGLDTVLEASGLKRVGRVRHLVPEHNFHGMWFALLGRVGMTPGFPFHLLKRNVPARTRDIALLALAGPLLLPIAVVLELGAAAARRGGTMAVVARSA